MGFHVCFDASKPCPGEGSLAPAPKKGKTAAKKSESPQSRRWDAQREHFQERDEQIVTDYKAGMGLRHLAEKNSISHTTVIKIIRRAEEDSGEKIMRPRGANNRWNGRKEVKVVGGFQ